MYVDEIYNFCLKYFENLLMVLNINVRNHDFYGFFMFLIMTIKVSGIFTIVFVISASKYRSLQSFKVIRDKHFLEVRPKLLMTHSIRNKFSILPFKKFLRKLSIRLTFYILIMDEKVLVLCEK